MAPKKKPTKHSFSPEIKAEALRLVFEEGYTAKKAAEFAGCSTFSIQQWKAAAKKNGNGKVKAATKTVADTVSAEPTVKIAKTVKKTKKAGKKGKKVAKKIAETAAVTTGIAPVVTFDAFVHAYWNECPGATDLLQLPPDIMPTAVEYVNNVLRYAYDRLN